MMNPASNKKSPSLLHLYRWQGVNQQGKVVRGELAAGHLLALTTQLQQQGILLQQAHRKRQWPFSKANRAIKSTDITLISRQLTTLLNAGLPLVQSLQLMAKSHQKNRVRQLMALIADEVASGTPLSDTLRQHPRYFNTLYCDLVNAGEQSGALDTIFERLARYREKADTIRAKIKKALLYPAVVLIVAIIVTTLLLVFVIPQFEMIFQGFGAPLPSFTLWVLTLAKMLREYGVWFALALAVGLFSYTRAWHHSQLVRNKTDALLLKLPIVGTILQHAALARFAQTLSTSTSAGITLLDALRASAGAAGNGVYRQAILTIRSEVEAGLPMHMAMRSVGYFPDMVVQMVMVGEESGTLDDMLHKVALLFEQQVDNTVEGLTSLLEPLIMVVLGTLVGGIVIAMYLPIFELGKVAG